MIVSCSAQPHDPAIEATAPIGDVAGIRARLKLNTLTGALAYVLDAVRVVAPELVGRMIEQASPAPVPA